ncbi:hypothetical protein RvY_11561 [Ramazzottius varieornatus]|uniref:Uncharacterized protein n=1 Tax=Ramazzottius varieornatus TaxID=947166 RepID=A0A1D1VQC3_RAMVA|nr:hypothetical protein RvY_11561 [Ramazzottius varieornatus]
MQHRTTLSTGCEPLRNGGFRVAKPPGNRGRALNFLLQKASLFGLPMPTPARAASKPPSIYLPSDLSPMVLYVQYLQMFPKEGAEKGVSKNTSRWESSWCRT